MTKIKSNLPTISFFLLIVLAWIIAYVYFHPVPQPAVALESLNELQEKSIEIILEMNKLIISLSLLLIGGIGAFLLQKYQSVKIHSLAQRMTIVLSIISASLSIYFGYVLYFRMVEMLSNNWFNPQSNLIEQPLMFQYYSFLLSVVLFGLFVINATVPKGPDQQ